MGKKRRIEEIDGVLHFECSTCREMKTEDEFSQNKKNPINLNYYCRQCLLNDRQNRPTDVRLDNCHYRSYVETATDILTKLGYNMEEDISEQFINRIKEKYGVDLS